MTASKGNSARPPGSCASLALRSYWLLVICLLAISSQTYDWPGAIEPYLRRMIGITGEQLAALYSAYHAPNVIVVILGGILIDVIGPDSASVGFTAIILISSFILASRLSFGVLIISRVLLGIGSESLQIAQMALLNRAFDRRSRKDKVVPGKSTSGGRKCCASVSCSNPFGGREDFPTIAFSYALSNAVLRAVTLTILYTLPGLVNSNGWAGINLVTGVSIAAFLMSLLLLSMEKGWVACCDVRPFLVTTPAATSPSSGPDSPSGTATDNPLAVLDANKNASAEGSVVTAATTGGTNDVPSKESTATAPSAGSVAVAVEAETPTFDVPSKHQSTNEMMWLLRNQEAGADQRADSDSNIQQAKADEHAEESESKEASDGDQHTESTPLLVKRKDGGNDSHPPQGPPGPPATKATKDDNDKSSRGCLLCCQGKPFRIANTWCCSTTPTPGPGRPGTPEARCFSWLNVFSGSFCTPALLVHALFALLFTASALPFGEINTALFASVYGYSDEQAARTSSIQTIVSMATMLPYGLLLDSRLVSYHAVLLWGTTITAIAWALLAVTSSASYPSLSTNSIPPQVPIALAGFGGAAINTAVWPMFGFRLPQEVQGRVFGLLTAVQNGVMIISPLIIGSLRDNAYEAAQKRGDADPQKASFPPAMWFLFGGTIVCGLLLILLGFLDGWEEPTHTKHLDPNSMLVLGSAAPLMPPSNRAADDASGVQGVAIASDIPRKESNLAVAVGGGGGGTSHSVDASKKDA